MPDPYARWWRRSGTKKAGFTYTDAAGRRITAPVPLKRIDSLRIPPAWTDVRIAPTSRSNLQAIGLDQKGRKQYLYHPDWVHRQAEAKYQKLVSFVRRLPHFREVTSAHLAMETLGREKVLAVVTRLINEGCFRIGGERYTLENKSYGISTLCVHHLTIEEECLRFAYRGKKGVDQVKVVPDQELVALMRELVSLPGRRLFKYPHDDGRLAPVNGREVNAYIKEIMGAEFSAKDFRTWGGTLMAAHLLASYGPVDDPKTRRKNMVRCVKEVASFLGNTPAIARASYIAPIVFSCYEHGLTLENFAPRGRQKVALQQQGYTPEEFELMKMLSISPESLEAAEVRITMLPERGVREKAGA